MTPGELDQCLGLALRLADEAGAAIRPYFRQPLTVDDKADLTPYQARPAAVKLDELNPKKDKLKGQALYWAEKSEALDFTHPDSADEDTLNRILWFAAREREEYPAGWAGAHGRGLAALKLRLASR